MKRKRIVILSVLALLLVGILLAAAAAKSYIKNYDKLVSEIKISDVDLSKIPDGRYTGRYSAFPVTVEVRVTVISHHITGIDLVKHENGRGSAAEAILDRVVEAQTLKVDTVSGATISSRVILKAIENAINSAVK